MAPAGAFWRRLGASTLLTAALAWQAFTSSASHRALAQRVLRDYAELAATEFSRRTTAYVITRTVDTHMFELRRKLEADAARPRHIMTARGIGYRLGD